MAGIIYSLIIRIRKKYFKIREKTRLQLGIKMSHTMARKKTKGVTPIGLTLVIQTEN